MLHNTPEFQQVKAWIQTMRPHWARCKGNVHNDSKFWLNCIHNTGSNLWISVIEVYHEAKNLDADIDRRYPYLSEDLFAIAQRIDADRMITIPYNKEGYNKPVFRAAMAIKDVVCKITGEPMLDDEIKPQRKRPTRDEILADFDKLKAKIEALYD